MMRGKSGPSSLRRSLQYFTGALAIIGLVQITDNRQSSERQLRAYVNIATTGYNSNVADIVIKNFGATPAYDLTFWDDEVLRF